MASGGHSSRTHADLPPSSADKWMRCLGWLRTVSEHREKFGTPPSSAAADEGTRAHELLEAHLKTLPNFVGDRAGAELLDESDPFFDDLLTCVDWIEQQEGDLHLETRLDFGASFGYVGLTGSVDMTFVEPARLTIADLKFGRGVVEASNNAQLLTYLSAARDAFGPRPEYRIVILQPRAYHPEGPIRVHHVTSSALEVFRFDLEEAIAGNYAGGPNTPGDHCRKFCSALSSCKAVAKASLQRFAETSWED